MLRKKYIYVVKDSNSIKFKVGLKTENKEEKSAIAQLATALKAQKLLSDSPD